MNHLFSIGELSKLQNISRQTLIFYDRIGLFCPAYVDPGNGYRYYSIRQLDDLDAICMMKKIGFSLDEIKAHMQHHTLDHSIAALRRQQRVIDGQIGQLQMIKSRVEHRCQELEHAAAILQNSERVTVEKVPCQYLLCQKVASPYGLEGVSIATKQCFVRAFQEKLPVYFFSGAIVPYERILRGDYTQASYAFLPMEKVESESDMVILPEGKCVCSYHTGDYPSIGPAYERILKYCRENHWQIVSDSYEFALNDYLSTGDESEYVTRIMFYVQRDGENRI